MKYKTLIVDDEKQARNSIKADLKKHNDIINIIAEADSVNSAIELVNSTKPDVVFLDINLGDGSGFDVLEKVTYKNFKVVFVTAYDQFAIKAFKVNALDFLLKPIDLDELDLTIKKLTEQSSVFENNPSIESAQSLVNSQTTDKKIVVKDLEAIYVLKLNNLIYCEASGIYTIFHMMNGEQIISSKNLKEYEEYLEPHNFLRVHNSFLVNGKLIIKFEKNDGGTLVMENAKKIPVSQRKKDVVIEYLKSLNDI